MYYRCLLIFLLLIVQPVTAFAYSYGDPNKEEVAETYKEIAAKLEKSPEDWAGALSAYNARKAEIVLEFGQSLSDTIESNLKSKQKDLALHNYRVVLVKNVERRLKSVDEEFNDYAKAKLMLAKGRGTFVVLEPFVGEAGSKKVYAAFDKALTALGNPGLFGVGVVAPDKQLFQTEKNVVMSTLAPLASIKAGAAAAKQEPAKTAAAQPATPAQQPAAAKPAQPAATPQQATKPVDASAQPAAKQPVATAGQNPAAPTETPAAAITTAPAAPADTQTTPEQPAQPASGSANNATGATAESATAPTAPPEAPAESKVNPAVTVGVIGGILVLAGGAFWIGKRKGLL
ncbi:hypothetical protein ACTID9_21055 [Brevibacillus fluminis]|uniref:hypothetical protein n=1 Tax=Brevibacillus fluminis TaxID=511487 RepID=UPI003F8B1E97